MMAERVERKYALVSLVENEEVFNLAKDRIKIVRRERQIMGWFSRRPVQQKQVGAAITVASNLYLQTKPGAKDAPVALQFSLPDSQYRYLIFCFSAMATGCAREMKNPDAVMSECLSFLGK